MNRLPTSRQQIGDNNFREIRTVAKSVNVHCDNQKPAGKPMQVVELQANVSRCMERDGSLMNDNCVNVCCDYKNRPQGAEKTKRNVCAAADMNSSTATCEMWKRKREQETHPSVCGTQ